MTPKERNNLIQVKTALAAKYERRAVGNAKHSKKFAKQARRFRHQAKMLAS